MTSRFTWIGPCIQYEYNTNMCFMASPKRTRFIIAFISLYESRASTSVPLSDCHDGTGKYFGSPTPRWTVPIPVISDTFTNIIYSRKPEAKWQNISGSAFSASSSKS